MKHLVIGSCDFIINSNGIPNVKEDNKTDWVDQTALLANGRYMPDGVTFFAEHRDEFGNSRRAVRVYLMASDIKSIAQKMKELESTEQVIEAEDDLPY